MRNRNNSPKEQARRELDSLFASLRRRASQCQYGAIEVNYPQHYARGKCVIGIVVPLEPLSMQTLKNACTAYDGWHYPPAIIASRGKLCLRLLYRFRGIEPGQQQQVFTYAQTLAKWAEGLFGMPSFITPVSGLVELCVKLEATPA